MMFAATVYEGVPKENRFSNENAAYGLIGKIMA